MLDGERHRRNDEAVPGLDEIPTPDTPPEGINENHRPLPTHTYETKSWPATLQQTIAYTSATQEERMEAGTFGLTHSRDSRRAARER